jgi:hypothetical protein
LSACLGTPGSMSLKEPPALLESEDP